MTNKELLKIYSAYLPYVVKLLADEYKDIHTLLTVCSNNSIVVKNNEDKGFEILIYGDFKLLLRPLSDLTKEIEHNGEKFVPLIKMGFPNKTSVYNDITYIIKKGHTPYIEMQKLLEWHFDVFGLLDKNLAINLNEVK